MQARAAAKGMPKHRTTYYELLFIFPVSSSTTFVAYVA